MTAQSETRKKQTAVLCAGGVAAGFLNGLLGTGAGIVLLFTLWIIRRAQFAESGQRDAAEYRDFFSTSLCGVFVISLFSAVFYRRSGLSVWQEFAPLALPAMLGGAAGAILLSYMRPTVLKAVFSAVLAVSGVLMLI